MIRNYKNITPGAGAGAGRVRGRRRGRGRGCYLLASKTYYTLFACCIVKILSQNDHLK